MKNILFVICFFFCVNLNAQATYNLTVKGKQTKTELTTTVNEVSLVCTEYYVWLIWDNVEGFRCRNEPTISKTQTQTYYNYQGSGGVNVSVEYGKTKSGVVALLSAYYETPDYTYQFVHFEHP